MKRKINLIAIIAIVCLVLTAICFVACDPIVEDSTLYTVTASFDNNMGNVSISASANTNGYAKNENVTVSASANGGCALTSITVNGESVSLSSNQYSFAISCDTEIVATFAKVFELANDDKKGNVSISSPQNCTGYVRGESVSVDVTPAQNFNVLSCTVDGNTQNVVNNHFTFVIGDQMPQIEIFYKGAPMPQSVLDSLSGCVKFSGSYVYDISEGDDTSHTIETTFGDEVIHQVERVADTGELLYNDVIIRSKDIPRAIAFVQRTIENEIVEITNSNYNWFEYTNQFDLFTVDDFEYVEEGTYAFVDSAKAKRAASAITGWIESISSFVIYVKDGIAVGAHIVTEEIQTGFENTYYVSTYDFEISEHGVATVDENLYKPYQTTDDHLVLKEALQNASSASYYTIRHFAHEVGYDAETGQQGDGYGDLDYNVYVTQNTVYIAFSGEEYGYRVKDGYVYPFDYESVADKIVFHDPLAVDSINVLKAVFNGFAVELFEYVGNGRYELRDNYLASEIAEMFGEGVDEKNYYSYSLDIAITLKDGELYQIELLTYVYGFSEEITLTYDFDTPVDINLNFDDASRDSVLDPFKGTYADSEGNYAIVDDYGFTINGIKAEIYAYDREQGIFTLLWNNSVLYVVKLSLKQMLVQSDDYSLFITFTMFGSETVKIPNEFKGVWGCHYEDNVGVVEYHVEIQSYVVKMFGQAISVLSYTENEGLVCEDGDGNTYAFYFIEDAGERYFYIYHIFSNGSYISCILTPTGEEIGIEIPMVFVGTYLTRNEFSATYKRVDITTSKITIDGIEFVPTAYDAKAQKFTGTYKEISDFVISFGYTSDHLVVGPSGEGLYRTEVILPTYIGTWQSSYDKNDPNDKLYIVEITETTISINGQYVNFKHDEYGYTFLMDGSPYETHILYFSSNTSGQVMLWMYDNNVLLKSLTKVGSGDSEIKFPNKYVGTWSGTSKQGNAYTFEISPDLVIMTINGEVHVVDAYYDDGSILFVYNNLTYVLNIYDGTLNFYIEEDRTEYCVSLTKSED